MQPQGAPEQAARNADVAALPRLDLGHADHAAAQLGAMRAHAHEQSVCRPVAAPAAVAPLPAPAPIRLPALDAIERATSPAEPMNPVRAQHLTPVLQQRVAHATARAAATQAGTEAQVAAAEARASECARIARQRREGEIAALRQQQTQEEARLEERQVRAIEARRASHDTKLTVRRQAAESDAVTLTARAEEEARRRREEARTRALAARARAASTSALGFAQGGRDVAEDPDAADAEAEAIRIQAEADALIEQLLAAAADQRADLLAAASAELAQLIAEHHLDLSALLEDALSAFPHIAEYYTRQITELVESLAADPEHPRSAEEQQRLIEAAAGQLSIMLQDIAQIAQFNSDNPAESRRELREAFGISFVGSDSDGVNWTDESEEATLLSAVLTEGAFRRAGGDSFADRGFGELFTEMFGGVTFHDNSAHSGGAEVLNGEVYVYRNIGDLGDFAAFMENMIHELGHVFDYRAKQHGKVDFAQDQQRGQLGTDAALNAAMGKSQSDEETPGEMFADMFLNWVMGTFTNTEDGIGAKQWMNDHMFGSATAEDWRERSWTALASQPRDEHWRHGELDHLIVADDATEILESYYDLEIGALSASLREHDQRWAVGNTITIPSNLEDGEP